MKVRRVLLWSQLSGLTVEFELEERTFQITGRNGMIGYWERFFPENDHPYRRKIDESEMEKLLSFASVFLIYKIWRDEAETLARGEFEKKIKDIFKGVKGGKDA